MNLRSIRKGLYRVCQDMSRQPVSLFNVHDTEAFVRSAIRKGRKVMTTDQRDELVAEGMRIMVKLAHDYEPGRNGQDASQSSFSAYAWKFLPGKLSDAANRLHGGHLATLPDGSRKWQYDQPPASLDSMVQDAPEGVDNVSALQTEDVYDSDLARNLGRAFDEQAALERDHVLKLGVTLGLGEPIHEAVKMTCLSGPEASRAVDWLQRLTPRLGALEAA